MKRLKMRIVVLVLAALAASGVARGQTSASPLIAKTDGRIALSLDGEWQTIVDRYDTGLRARFYENRKAKSKSDLVEYDFDKSPLLKVPGDWNSQKESLFFYEGTVWYKKSFHWQKHPGRRVFLYFGAVNYSAHVYLNGQELGVHEGGFTPFDFEVTSLLNEGDNFVVVAVNNERKEGGVPGMDTDWWNYGGITRDVSLLEVPDVFVENFSVRLERSSPTDITAWAQINAPSGTARNQKVTLEIPEAHISETAETSAAGRVTFHFPAKLELWSPEGPKLYDVTLKTETDSISDEIGFRTVDTRGAQILLNGKPIFLRGVSMHEEAPYRGGRAYSEKDEETLLGWAKELGCNFIRLAHYPHNEHVARLADKMGILLWEEIPVYWNIAWENAATLASAEAQMQDVIERDQNRASVILWSLSNETPNTPARVEFLRKFATFTRMQDASRLITSALNTEDRSKAELMSLADPLGDFLDVIGINEYIGWYWGAPEAADKMEWQIKWDKPVIISEFGAGAKAGFHADEETRFSEEYQARVFRHTLPMLQKIPQLAGMSPWVLMDFRSPRRMLPGIQDYYNRKGLVSNQGQKKAAFGVLQEFYRQKAAESH